MDYSTIFVESEEPDNAFEIDEGKLNAALAND